MATSMLMCRVCGHFVKALERNGVLAPIAGMCPECDGTEFKDIHTGMVVRSDES